MFRDDPASITTSSGSLAGEPASPRGSRRVGGVSDHRTMTDATEREPALRPEDLERLVVERLNAGDVEGLVALYEPDAVMALPDRGTANGLDEIREAFAVLVADGPTFELGDQRPALHTGDLALTSTRLDDGAVTVEVARRQPDGTWLFVVDQPNING